jgi:TonB family protein
MRKLLFRLGVLLLILVTSPFVPRAHSQEAGQQAISRNVKTKVDPRYPELAKQYQLAGKVRLEVTVSADGTVKKTRLMGGNPLLAGAALDAIKQWRFEPGPKETVETIDFAFQFGAK